MTQVEDPRFVEKRLAVILAVALKRRGGPALKAYMTKGPIESDAALKELAAILAEAVSLHFEVGQVDANSRLYVTNYLEPRDPFRSNPVDRIARKPAEPPAAG